MTQSRGTQITEAPEERASLGHQLRIGAGVVAILGLLLFFLQNLQEVRMHFLWFDWDTRLIFALLVSAVVGGVAAWLIGALRHRGQRTKA
jgi:uncharacterized integral membrane protein